MLSIQTTQENINQGDHERDSQNRELASQLAMLKMELANEKAMRGQAEQRLQQGGDMALELETLRAASLAHSHGKSDVLTGAAAKLLAR